MGNSFRQQPGPTLYGENKTPVTEDVLEVGIVVAFAMIAFSFILIIPGIRGWEVGLRSRRCTSRHVEYFRPGTSSLGDDLAIFLRAQ